MRIRNHLTPLVLFLALTSGAPPASAQGFDAVGTRAQGMAGAFVAVADDATATWWNPAGLASGAYLSAILERGQNREPSDAAISGPAVRNSTSGFALAYPAMGLSYYRLRVSEIAPADSIGAAGPGRQDQGTASSVLRSVATTAFGATFGQSLGSHVVLASTVRLLRAGAVVSQDLSGVDPLDRADDFDVPRQTKTDLDIGALLRFRGVRLGGALKHVGEPAFGDGDARIVLKRQARAGIALTRGRTGVFDSLVGAVDLDVTSAPTAFGEERRVAAGGEVAFAGSRVLLRGGVSTPATGERRWTKSTGASVALRKGFFVDSAITPGNGASRSGWSVSLRSAF